MITITNHIVYCSGTIDNWFMIQLSGGKRICSYITCLTIFVHSQSDCIKKLQFEKHIKWSRKKQNEINLL